MHSNYFIYFFSHIIYSDETRKNITKLIDELRSSTFTTHAKAKVSFLTREPSEAEAYNFIHYAKK